MDLGLRGKKAIVTGGTRGIGRAIAEEFANEGCHVGICARDTAGVVDTVKALTLKGITATGRAVDVGDSAALKAWVHAVGNDLGGLDIVVSNVSGFGMTPDESGWRQSFEVDVMGTVHAIQAAMPFLEVSDAAAIVVISSGAAFESFDDVFPGGVMQPYAAMKAALTNYVANLSRTLAVNGIRANTVASGPVRSPAVGGSSASKKGQPSSPRCWRGVPWVALGGQRKWPKQSCFWPAQPRVISRGQI